MTSFATFLNGVSVKNILLMYQNGLFQNMSVDVLEEVFNHVINRTVLEGVMLDQFDLQIYELMRANLENKKLSVLKTMNYRAEPQPSTSRDLNSVNYSTEPRSSTSRDLNSEVNMQSNASVYQSGGRVVTENDAETNVQDISEEFNYLIKHRESEQVIKKFGLTARRLGFTFKAVAEETYPQEWLKKAIQELLDHVFRRYQPRDTVGLVLENEDFPEKPIGVSFRKLSQMNADVVMEIIGRIMQSNAAFFTNDRLSVRADCIRTPVGFGRGSAVDGKPVKFDEHVVSKNSIFVIENDDTYCLAMALIVGIEFCASGFDRKRINHFNTLKGSVNLKLRAINLCERTGVDLSAGGSYDHVVQFQNYLRDYVITVYNSRDGKTVFFEGDANSNKPRINLMFENQHYNLILSLTGAFSCSYFCRHCRVGYSNLDRHNNCPYICPCCHSAPPCDLVDVVNKCPQCLRVFRGEACLKRHKDSGLCQKLKRCRLCLETVWVNTARGKKHVCGVKYCNICMCNQEIRHNCYMAPNELTEKKKEENSQFLFLFYDLETMQEKQLSDKLFLHEVNLCVSQQQCSNCITNSDISLSCSSCGERQKIFRNNPVESFLEHIATLSKKFKVTAIAHNMKGFDGCFIMRCLFSDFARWKPSIIRTGAKIMSITCGSSVRFVDSLNFIQLPLALFPKAFQIEGCKGYFPHFFNTRENQNYIGPLPDLKYYGSDTMKTSEREKFLEWHRDLVENNYVFNMSEEIVRYCVSDVNILRVSCLKFRDCFLTTNKVDPLLECITIASACNLVYRRNFLQPYTIGIAPKGGYRAADKQSGIAIQWLRWVAHSNNLNIVHSGNGREVRLLENILVDGLCRDNNTVYEFHGCFWHGCERCYHNRNASLADKKDTMSARFEKTLFKDRRIREAGYNLIVMWECDFRKNVKDSEELKNFVKDHCNDIIEPLNVRDSFFGGRTNATKLYYKCGPGEKIRYLDVCSLYPFVNKYAKYPVGHPVKMRVGPNECAEADLQTLDGFVKCRVLPPTDLYHPVLPYKCNGKLTFPLCRECVENLNRGECQHDDEDRALTGTWVADELRKALELNYKVLEIVEVWEYKTAQYNKTTKAGGLFSGYVNNFLKIKQECTGWPQWCNSEDDKARYIAEYAEREGINLDSNAIAKNAGLRFLAKIMLNSFWGKFGQKENLQQTALINQPHELYELISNPAVEVHSISIINPEVLLVTWDRLEEDITPTKTVNVAIAAYTTAFARLELYKYLEKLGRRVLYYDTDSVLFIEREGDWQPPVGDFLGDLTDEMAAFGDGSYISEFVSGGPKNYSYKYWNANKQEFCTSCKVKGITLHYQNSQNVNFDKMKAMVCDSNAEPNIQLVDRVIVRNSKYEVMTKDSTKNYRINYTKRRRLDDSYDTLPYGFK